MVNRNQFTGYDGPGTAAIFSTSQLHVIGDKRDNLYVTDKYSLNLIDTTNIVHVVAGMIFSLFISLNFTVYSNC